MPARSTPGTDRSWHGWGQVKTFASFRREFRSRMNWALWSMTESLPSGGGGGSALLLLAVLVGQSSAPQSSVVMLVPCHTCDCGVGSLLIQRESSFLPWRRTSPPQGAPE